MHGPTDNAHRATGVDCRGDIDSGDGMLTKQSGGDGCEGQQEIREAGWQTRKQFWSASCRRAGANRNGYSGAVTDRPNGGSQP
jgi:hypothetical protein